MKARNRRTIKNTALVTNLTEEEVVWEVERILDDVDGLFEGNILPKPLFYYILCAQKNDIVPESVVAAVEEYLETVERKPLFGGKGLV